LRLAHDTPEAVDQATQTLWSTDLIVLPHGFISDLPHVDLHRDRWVLVVSADDDEVGESLTVDQLTTMPWVATYRGPTASTSTARQMRMLGVEPRVSVVTESSLTVPGLVAGSDRIGLLQVRLVRLLPVDVGICALPPPFELGPLVEAMWWHPVYDHNPEHEFFLDLVLRAAHQPTERTT
jgi:DNA-binding transcriptional LysR family regulator